MPGRLLDHLPLLVFAVEIEDVGDEIEGMLIILNFRIEAGQIKSISQVVLIDFTEVFVSSGRNELCKSKVSKQLQAELVQFLCLQLCFLAIHDW